MPIKVFSLNEAFQNRKSEISKWPSDEESQTARLLPIARPSFDAPFRIKRDGFIFTVGSCFARNIERQLANSGFDFAAKNFKLGHDESDFRGLDVSGVLNKYVIFSILNDLKWALDQEAPYSDDYYVTLRGNKWWDPHLNNSIAPSSRERVLYRREKVNEYFKTAANADVFIMTLGLAEAWYDTKNEIYANGTPPASVKQTEPERFQFHILDYNDILSALEEIHKILTRFGRPDLKILVTVSPVALKSTFSGDDSLVANTYSKSVQRAAVAAFVAKHDNVTYFPSYESVVLSERSRAWEKDQLHASDEVVRYNVLAMMSAYVEDSDNGGGKTGQARVDSAAEGLRLMYAAEEADKEGQIAKAATLYASAAQVAPEEGLLLMNYARFLIKYKRFVEAVNVAQQSTKYGSDSYGGYGILANACRMAGRFDDAYAAIDKALALFPTKVGNLHAKALICYSMKKFEESANIYKKILLILQDNTDIAKREHFIRLYKISAKEIVPDTSEIFLTGYTRSMNAA